MCLGSLSKAKGSRVCFHHQLSFSSAFFTDLATLGATTSFQRNRNKQIQEQKTSCV